MGHFKRTFKKKQVFFTNFKDLPERVGKVDANTEVAVCLVDTVHTNPQLPRVTSTCCKCKDCKKLREIQQIYFYSLE